MGYLKEKFDILSYYLFNYKIIPNKNIFKITNLYYQIRIHRNNVNLKIYIKLKSILQNKIQLKGISNVTLIRLHHFGVKKTFF